MDASLAKELNNYLIVLVAMGMFCVTALVARLSQRVEWLRVIFEFFLWGYALITLGLGLLMGLTLLGKTIPAAQQDLISPISIIMTSIGLLTLPVLWQPSRRWILGWAKKFPGIPAQPDSFPHQVGLVLALMGIGLCLMLFSALTEADLLKQMDSANMLLGTFVMLLVFLLNSFTAIGFLLDRSFKDCLDRLGLKPITRQQLLQCLGWAFFLFALVQGVTYGIIQPYFPESFAFQAKIMAKLTAGLDGPNALIGMALVSIFAGLGEDIFFRGLMQPVIGVVLTSVLFALIHFQYGLTPALAIVFSMSLCLGFLRQRYNTTFAIVVHIFYDILALCYTIFIPKLLH